MDFLLGLQIGFLIFQYVYMFKMFKDITNNDYEKRDSDFLISIFNGICTLIISVIRFAIWFKKY